MDTKEKRDPWLDITDGICGLHERIVTLKTALSECMKDSFTVANGMSASGKQSPAGKRYLQAQAAIAKAEGRA